MKQNTLNNFFKTHNHAKNTKLIKILVKFPVDISHQSKIKNKKELNGRIASPNKQLYYLGSCITLQ